MEPLTRSLGKTGLGDSRKVTVEDAEDDSDEPKADKKKKKKKPKKKKKKPTATSTDDVVAGGISIETSVQSQSQPQQPSPALVSPSPPVTPVKEKKSTPSVNSTLGTAPSAAPSSTIFGGSTYSLPEQRAESAKSYLASLTSDKKEKVKTRPEEAEEKKSLFKKLGFRSKDAKPKEPEPNRAEKRTENVFVGLRKKSKICARKLFGLAVEDRKGSLKWDQFVHVCGCFRVLIATNT